jgi:hypothetical protein
MLAQRALPIFKVITFHPSGLLQTFFLTCNMSFFVFPTPDTLILFPSANVKPSIATGFQHFSSEMETGWEA